MRGMKRREGKEHEEKRESIIFQFLVWHGINLFSFYFVPLFSFPFLPSPLFSFLISKHIHSDPPYGHSIIKYIKCIYSSLCNYKVGNSVVDYLTNVGLSCDVYIGRIVYLLMQNILKRLYKTFWGCKSIDFLSCYIPIFFVI